MKTNLNTLTLEKYQSESICIALTYKDQPDKDTTTGRPYPSYWVIGKDEIDFVIRRLRGIESHRYVIDDGNYLIRFGTNGIYCTDTSSSRVQSHYVVFPGEILANALQALSDTPYNEDRDARDANFLKVDASTIESAAFKYRNRSKVIYHDGDDYSVKDIIIRLTRDPKTAEQFKSRMRSFIRQVGEACQPDEPAGALHLCLDSRGERNNKYPSFYFYLVAGNGKTMYNGGIINHSRDEDNPDYSIHT